MSEDFVEHLIQKVGEQLAFEVETVMWPAFAGAWPLVLNVTRMDDEALAQATGRSLRTVERWHIGQTPQVESRVRLVKLALEACGKGPHA